MALLLYTVTSQTLVTNLNADLLDGKHASAFQTKLTNPVTGSGSTGYLPRFTGATTIGSSNVYSNGTKVGIDTTNPGAKLEINAGTGHGLRIAGFGSGNFYGIDMSNSGLSGASDYFIYMNGSTYWSGEGWLRTANIRTSRVYESGNLKIDTGSSGHIILSPAGNVGIGTSTPGVKLDVVGDVRANEFLYSSDRALKTNIATIKNPINKIMKLRGVTFDWQETGSSSVGLIAQEVEKVFPELVAGEEGNKSVAYGNLVAPLIEAVKAQQVEIEMLRARIYKLELELYNN